MSSENKSSYFLNYEEMLGLLAAFDASETSELKLKNGDQKLVLKKATATPIQVVEPAIASAPAAQVMQSAAPSVQSEMPSTVEVAQTEDANVIEVLSEMVGTFYSKPTPEEEDYVQVGSLISKGTVICMIEAMKLFNEIKADLSGEIVEVLVSNGQMVEYGQPLFKVRKNG